MMKKWQIKWQIANESGIHKNKFNGVRTYDAFTRRSLGKHFQRTDGRTIERTDKASWIDAFQVRSLRGRTVRHTLS